MDAIMELRIYTYRIGATWIENLQYKRGKEWINVPIIVGERP